MGSSTRSTSNRENTNRVANLVRLSKHRVAMHSALWALALVTVGACGSAPLQPIEHPVERVSPDSTVANAARDDTSVADDDAALERASSPVETSDEVPGQTESEVESETAPPPPVQALPTFAEHGGECSLTGVSDIGTSTLRRTPVGLVADAAGGAVVFRSEPGQLIFRAIDSAGVPVAAPVGSPMPHLQRIYFVGRAADLQNTIDVVGVADSCGHQGAGCILSASFDTQGQPNAAPRSDVVHGSFYLDLRFPLVVGGVLHSDVVTRWGNQLVRFDRNGDAQLVHSRVTSTSNGFGPGWLGLGALLDSAGTPLGLTDDSWLTEGSRESYLVSPTSRVNIVGLPRRLTSSAATLSDGTLGVVFRAATVSDETHELSARGRHRFARVQMNGRLSGAVQDASLETLPPELGNVLNVSLETLRGHLHFVRRDALGRSLGQSLVIGRAPRQNEPSPRVTYSGTHFVVAHVERIERTWTVRTSAITCTPAPTD